MSEPEIDKAIRAIKDHTNRKVGNDPESFAPVAAKAAIALLEDMKGDS